MTATSWIAGCSASTRSMGKDIGDVREAGHAVSSSGTGQGECRNCRPV
jgi:hypothetical protein